MTYRLDHPEWLWVLAPGVVLTLLGAAWFGAMSPSRRVVAILTRLALLVLLTLTLAGLSARLPADRAATIIVLDQSGSVQRHYRDPMGRSAPEAVQAWLDQSVTRRGPDDLLGLVAFDGSALAAAAPASRTPRADTAPLPGTPGTNLAAALRLAQAMVPPEALGRLVLVSDGVQTAGDVLALSPIEGLPIDVLPLDYTAGDDVIVEALDGPPLAPQEAPVSVRIVLSSSGQAPGTLRLTSDGTVLASRELLLQPGLNIQRLDVKLPPGRVHRIEARWEPRRIQAADGSVVPAMDSVPENNRAGALIVTPGRQAVLLIDPAQEASPLEQALRQGAWDVTRLDPSDVPADLVWFQAFDLIVLDNVPAADLPERLQLALATAVSDMGAGLLVVGGPNSYAPGGWAGSALEPMLPVELRVPDIVLAPQSATLLVLDNSGSMDRHVLGTGQSQQQIANDAAVLAARSIDRSDLLGAITFNSRADVLIELARNDQPEATTRRLRAISADGGTNMGPALDLALEEMNVKAPGVKLRHVVVMTDGVSRDKSSLPDRVRRLTAQGIRVSTIAVGDAADVEQLAALAKLGGGEFFHAVNVANLPRLLVKAVRVVRSPLIRDEPFVPVRTDDSALTRGLDAVPPLGGLVVTRARTDPTAATVLRSPSGEPVLATWPAGVGRATAWTSDSRQWAASWIDTPAYATLWLQAARATARTAGPQAFAAEADTTDGELRVTLRQTERLDLPGLSFSASAFAPDGTRRPLVLVQTRPGEWQASGPAPEIGTHVVVVRPTASGTALQPILVGTTTLEGAEFRARASDPSLLALLAQRTGGRVLSMQAPPADLFPRDSATPREVVRPLHRSLLWWCLTVVLLDIAVRRVAWDRWFSRLFNPTELLAQTTTATDRLRRAAAAPIDPGLALGDRDARDLVRAARDRRRAERLGPISPPAPASPASQTPAPPPAEAPSEGLLAAKRRARQSHERADDET